MLTLSSATSHHIEAAQCTTRPTTARKNVRIVESKMPTGTSTKPSASERIFEDFQKSLDLLFNFGPL